MRPEFEFEFEFESKFELELELASSKMLAAFVTAIILWDHIVIMFLCNRLIRMLCRLAGLP